MKVKDDLTCVLTINFTHMTPAASWSLECRAAWEGGKGEGSGGGGAQGGGRRRFGGRQGGGRWRWRRGGSCSCHGSQDGAPGGTESEEGVCARRHNLDTHLDLQARPLPVECGGSDGLHTHSTRFVHSPSCSWDLFEFAASVKSVSLIYANAPNPNRQQMMGGWRAASLAPLNQLKVSQNAEINHMVS